MSPGMVVPPGQLRDPAATLDRNSATASGTPRVSPVSLSILAIIRTSTTSSRLPASAVEPRMLTASARSSNRTRRGGWSRCSSPLESPNHSCRQLHRNKQVGRVHVVLAGFIDDADVAFATRFAIRKQLINLACLEVLHAAVFDAQRERTRRLLNSHDLS